MEISDKQRSLARFWKKFLRLTRGRVTVLRTLELASEEEKDPDFKRVIQDVRKKLDSGAQLSEALREHPADFSPSVVELVRAAEKSGAWDEILVEITDGLSEGTFE